MAGSLFVKTHVDADPATSDVNICIPTKTIFDVNSIAGRLVGMLMVEEEVNLYSGIYMNQT
jgi:hypothetical protein